MSCVTYTNVHTDGGTCFTGHCHKKCDKEHAICGQPDVLPVSFALLIPEAVYNGWRKNPAFSRPASSFDKRNYCNHLTESINKISSAVRLHLDIVDIILFDFLQGEKRYQLFFVIDNICAHV